jgi:protein TonB
MSASLSPKAAARPSMKRRAGLLAAAATMAFTGAAWAHLPAAPPPAAAAPAATSLAVQQQAAADPAMAQVVLDCMVADQGAVKDCAIVSEEPAGSGYGAAALQMASQFRLTLKADGGVAVPGQRLSIPIRIRIAK